MHEQTSGHGPVTVTSADLPRLVPRAAFGGILMGLGNIVPGVSSGTMLLVAGVYQYFLNAIAEVSTLKFRPASLAVLATILACAGLAILLLAGPVVAAMLQYRWQTYAVFIGLTLGGAPIVWKLARPASASLWVGFAGGIVFMALFGAMEFMGWGIKPVGTPPMWAFFLGGLVAGAATILPGIGGGFFLLILGQFVHLLASVDEVKQALGARDIAAAMATWKVLVPAGLGVVVGVVTVSHLLRFLMSRYEKATYGVLLGLLVGCVFGLWPFENVVPPEVGTTIRGTVVTAENLAEFPKKEWPTEGFTPSAMQVVYALLLAAGGYLLTVGIARFGGEESGPRERGEREAE